MPNEKKNYPIPAKKVEALDDTLALTRKRLFCHTNHQDCISQEWYCCLHMGKREAEVFFYIQADRLAEEKVEKDA